ncbi:MAG: hypothetical protein M1832_000333 [Thelocarpon impressellum]|nr:MAG: hypothetical protein M1832_000333 [Thelocarpon impressellum]
MLAQTSPFICGDAEAPLRRDAMPSKLRVIALISGGKDSLFSILHCVANGHDVVALVNLFPPPLRQSDGQACVGGPRTGEATPDDLNSYMYQTVGHTVIPLYEEALGIPLYRQEISGTAIIQDRIYDPTACGHVKDSSREDETEALVPVLQRVMLHHPDADAVSTGAILSDYQRTRVESVATRLGLIPLSYLWHYPSLPPGTQASLLDDMAAVGQDARIIKVASGGLDASSLWENVATEKGKRGLMRKMKRFGGSRDGAILGEGGEFETLATDGPRPLWKKRIEIREDERMPVHEGAGSALLRITGARLVPKSSDTEEHAGNGKQPRIPDLLDADFSRLFDSVSATIRGPCEEVGETRTAALPWQNMPPAWCSHRGDSTWSISNMTHPGADLDPAAQTEGIVQRLRVILGETNNTPGDVVCTTILLRSMASFSSVNETYGKLFSGVNPPARVTVAMGDTLPLGVAVMLSIVIDIGRQETRTCLHVQSRSYWAPANIGPYSQAISTPLSTLARGDEPRRASLVYIAGQIPLVPPTMDVVMAKSPNYDSLANFRLQGVLAMQHLWRIARVMRVNWWGRAIAFIAGDQDLQAKSMLAWEMWRLKNRDNGEATSTADDGDEADGPDLWDQRYGGAYDTFTAPDHGHEIPDWGVVDEHLPRPTAPPFLAVHAEELPRGCDIEWAAIGLEAGRVSLSEERGPITTSQSCVLPHDRAATLYATIEEQCDDFDWDRDIMSILRRKMLASCQHVGSAELNVEEVTIYTARPLSDIGLSFSPTLIRSKSLWGPNGRRLGAAVFVRASFGAISTS